MSGAGAKFELLTFEREVAGAPDGTGGRTMSWVTLGLAWAEPRYVRGGEREAQGVLREINAYRFIVWSAAVAELALTVNDVILWNGERYNIREMPRRLSGGPETEILAETGVTL